MTSTTDLIERLADVTFCVGDGESTAIIPYSLYQQIITALSPVLPDATAVNTLGELQQEIERLQADNADKSQLLARFQGRIDEYEQALEQAFVEAKEGRVEMTAKFSEWLERIREMK